jgi:hypothetical protein
MHHAGSAVPTRSSTVRRETSRGRGAKSAFADPTHQTNRNLLYDEITTIDHALTRPWTVTQNYRRSPSPQPFWREYVCAENNSHVRVGNETYYLSADGLLMPAKKDQPPPDLRYFNPTRK